MEVVSSFYSVSKEDMENRQNEVIDNATKLHPKNQKEGLWWINLARVNKLLLRTMKLKLTIKHMLSLLKMTLELRRVIKIQK